MPFAPRFPSRPWAPLATDELHALLPSLLPRVPQGARVRDLRTRLDALFWLAATPLPWRSLPERFGKPDTVARWFRRLCHSGLWHELLHRLADAEPHSPLARIGHWILRACRRAERIAGQGFQRLIRRLRLLAGLPGPPWMLPNPLLSETLRRCLTDAIERGGPRQAIVPLLLRALVRCLRPPPPTRALARSWC